VVQHGTRHEHATPSEYAVRSGSGQLRVMHARRQISAPDHEVRQAEQVDAVQGEFEPGGVDRELPGREPAEAGGLAGADAVLDPGVCAVAGVEERQLPGGGVGGQTLVAPAVTLFEGVELGAGVRAFSADGLLMLSG